MKIEYTQLFELDEIAERERITKNFKGNIRKRLLSCLDDFVASRWDAVIKTLLTFSRAEREYLHPVVSRVSFDTLRRNNLKVNAIPSDLKMPQIGTKSWAEPKEELSAWLDSSTLNLSWSDPTLIVACNSYPAFLKRGFFVQGEGILRKLHSSNPC